MGTDKIEGETPPWFNGGGEISSPYYHPDVLQGLWPGWPVLVPSYTSPILIVGEGLVEKDKDVG